MPLEVPVMNNLLITIYLVVEVIKNKFLSGSSYLNSNGELQKQPVVNRNQLVGVNRNQLVGVNRNQLTNDKLIECKTINVIIMILLRKTLNPASPSSWFRFAKSNGPVGPLTINSPKIDHPYKRNWNNSPMKKEGLRPYAWEVMA
jgi:hypothetical protein